MTYFMITVNFVYIMNALFFTIQNLYGTSLGCGSPLYSIAMTLRKTLILLLIFLLDFSLGLPYVKFYLHYHEFVLPY